MKKNFKQMVAELNPLKELTDNTQLPYVFDLYWDAKIGIDLLVLKDNVMVRRILSEHGYDVKKWLEKIRS